MTTIQFENDIDFVNHGWNEEREREREKTYRKSIFSVPNFIG